MDKFTSLLKIIFKSLKDNGDEREMFLKSVNIVVTGVRSTKLIDVLYDSLFMEYQQNMIKKMKVGNLFLIILIGYILVNQTFNWRGLHIKWLMVTKQKKQP